MKSAAPWVIAVIAIIAFGASFSELQRMRARFGEVSRHQFHDHQEVRQFMIRAALEGVDQPIVVLGDSVTEMARLPETIDERRVVNAGIGGATIADIEAAIPLISLAAAHPSLIVVELGNNEAGSPAIQRDYAALLSKLKTLAPRLLAVGVSRLDGSDFINTQIKSAADSNGIRFVAIPLPEGSFLPDRIHLNATGYLKWTPSLVAARLRS